MRVYYSKSLSLSFQRLYIMSPFSHVYNRHQVSTYDYTNAHNSYKIMYVQDIYG